MPFNVYVVNFQLPYSMLTAFIEALCAEKRELICQNPTAGLEALLIVAVLFLQKLRFVFFAENDGDQRVTSFIPPN